MVALLAGVASLAVVAAAQDEHPQITPGERKVPRKKEAGPRAVAVLQLAANGKSSLVPVAVLVGGKFWDASVYKANPIPMALETGTVYEAERTGSSLGLFTVNSALHSNAVNVMSPWIGTGKWLPGGVETKTELKAENVPVGIETGDGPPRLTRDPQPAASAPAATPHPSSAPSQSSGPSASGDEPPRLTKSAPPPEAGQSPPAQGSTAPGSATPGSTTPGSTAPGSTAPPAAGDSKSSSDSKPSDAKPDEHTTDAHAPGEQAKLPESDSGASGANRPTLRRGKPIEPLPDEEVPGYSKPGKSTSTAATAAKPAEAAAANDKGPVELIPAISDESAVEPRSFAFTWLKDEEGERLKQMTALARDQVRAYVDARARAKIVPKIAPKPADPQGARHTSSANSATKTKDPILENVKMTAYDLWTNNQPVLVFSAEAHMPPPPAGTAFSAVDAELQYSVLLIAYPDTYNNLHKIYSGVTDKYHLDLTPRLELIDALDADGDLHGELLFRETSDNGAGWVIYRASQDKLWKMFDSLHPE